MNKTSKKTVIISAALCAMLGVCGITAYFTDNDSAVNKVSIGEVKIDLTEPTWDESPDTDGDGVPDIAEDVVPTQSITKDPMVTNTGKDSAYIYLKVSVPKANIYTANEDGTKNDKAVTQLFTYTYDSTGWELIESDTSDKSVNTYIYGYKSIVDPEKSTGKLFEEMTFCNAVEGQGLENTVQNINIDAYGIQSYGSTSVKDAYTKYMNQNK